MAINSVSNMLNAGSLFNTNSYQKQDSISKLWSAYGSYQSNAQNSLAGLTEVNANLKAVLASYDDAKNAFKSEFEESMNALSKSADKLKSYNFNVEKDGAITKTTGTDDNGVTTTTTTYSKDLQAALDTVKGFVEDYNSAIKFFGDNSSVSKRVERLATTFGDTTYRANIYESIGLNVNSNGSFTIDEEKLANAIVNDPRRKRFGGQGSRSRHFCQQSARTAVPHRKGDARRPTRHGRALHRQGLQQHGCLQQHGQLT